MSARIEKRSVPILAIVIAIAIAGCGGEEEEPKEREPGAVIVKPPRGESEVREHFNELVGDLLESRGLDSETIECALTELGDSISDSEIEEATDEIIETGVPPPAVTEAAAAAGEACVGSSGGTQ